MRQILLAIVCLMGLVSALKAQSSNAGSGEWEILPWGRLPQGGQWGSTSQISTTPEGQILVLQRADPFFVLLTPDGDVVRTWGENLYHKEAHGLRVDRQGFIWATDNLDHLVQKWSPSGKLLMTLGT